MSRSFFYFCTYRFLIPAMILFCQVGWAQQLPDLSGTWYSNGLANAKATISQSGNKLNFSYNQSNSSGYFSGPLQIFALEWNTTAEVSNDLQTIKWNNQIWTRKPATIYPDISGVWYKDGDLNASCQITQDGFNLNFVMANSQSSGYFYEENKIYAKEWNAYAELAQDLQTLKWNNQTWLRSAQQARDEAGVNRTYCRFELSSFYYAAQLLGSAWGRSAHEPATPTADGINAMQDHVRTAIKVYSAQEYSFFSACMKYDLGKLRKLLNGIPSMSSTAIRESLETIIKELQVSIQHAPFQCDHGVHPGAIYVAGIHLGAAQAHASFQQCRAVPMPLQIANTIRDHLNVARTALMPYRACLHATKTIDNGQILAFDFNGFGAVPLASMNSIAAHTFIVGIETQLLWAIALSPCCCKCAARSGDGEIDRPQTPPDINASPCDADCNNKCKLKGYAKGKYNGKAPCLLGIVYEGGCDCGN